MYFCWLKHISPAFANIMLGVVFIMKNLKKGTEPNALELIVDNINVKPYSKMKNGMIEDGVVLKFSKYNLEDVLCQMLDDYGQDELIKRIKALE